MMKFLLILALITVMKRIHGKWLFLAHVTVVQ